MGTGVRAIVLGVFVAGAPVMALGQLVPPPGEAPAPRPVVAPPTPPRVAPPIRSATPPADGDAARLNAEAEARRRLAEQSAINKLPDLPYDSLVQRDAGGRIIPVEGNLHLAALSRNPLMDDSSVERCQGVIAGRRARMEEAVIENIDLVQKVLDGAIERADIADRESVSALVAVVRPFQEMGHLTEDLKAQQYLTEQQYGFNWKIVREYEQEMQRQVMADAAGNQDPDAPNPMSLVTRLIMGEYLREPMEAYDSLLLEGSQRLDRAMAGITLSSGSAAKAGPLMSAVRAAPNDEARLAAMRELAGLMDAGQKGQLLSNVLSSR